MNLIPVSKIGWNIYPKVELNPCAVGRDSVPLRLEPEKRRVAIDARITVDGVFYEVEPDLAGEKVVLWWGLFDNELYVEHQETRYGPYHPVGNPIPREKT